MFDSPVNQIRIHGVVKPHVMISSNHYYRLVFSSGKKWREPLPVAVEFKFIAPLSLIINVAEKKDSFWPKKFL